MLNTLAALGIGVAATLSLPATANAHCDPSRPHAHHPGHLPAPAHAPVPPAPTYAPAPYQRVDARDIALMRRADYNRDGWVTLAEARAHGRARFDRIDTNNDRVLSPHEIRRHDDEIARDAIRGRDRTVTYSEYDSGVRARFASLDVNRDGYLSNYELNGTPPPRATYGASVGWRW